LGGLVGAGWALSITMLGYFGFYLWRLATWPVTAGAASPAERVL
jgi:hypothetical protein